MWVNSEMSPNVMIDYWLLHTFKGTLYCTRRSMSLHLRGQQLRRSIGRKESFHQVLQRFNSHTIALGTPKWAPFCWGTPKHDGRDVMWKNTIYIIEKVAKDLLTQHFTVSYMIFLLFLSDFNIIHNAPWTQTYLLLSGWSYSYLCFSSSILYNQNRGNCNVKNKTHDHFRKHSS